MSDEMRELSKESILIQLSKNINGLLNLIGMEYLTIEISPDQMYIDGYENYDGQYHGNIHIIKRWEDV